MNSLNILTSSAYRLQWWTVNKYPKKTQIEKTVMILRKWQWLYVGLWELAGWGWWTAELPQIDTDLWHWFSCWATVCSILYLCKISRNKTWWKRIKAPGLLFERVAKLEMVWSHPRFVYLIVSAWLHSYKSSLVACQSAEPPQEESRCLLSNSEPSEQFPEGCCHTKMFAQPQFCVWSVWFFLWVSESYVDKAAVLQLIWLLGNIMIMESKV